MISKPNKCCDCGTYKCQVPMPINGKVEYIDLCIAPIVAALNAANIRTIASCCGHGTHPANVVIEDGRELFVACSYELARRLENKLKETK